MSKAMRVFIILALAILTACSPPAASAPAATTHAAQRSLARLLVRDTRTLLQGPNAHAAPLQCSRRLDRQIQGVWSPSEIQLDAADAALEPVLSDQLQKRHETASVENYYRQYAGLILDGRHVIYSNGVTNALVQGMPRWASNGDWHRDVIGACGGGTIGFGAVYDVDSDSISNFTFNSAG